MLSFFPRDVLDEIWNLIVSVSEGFPTYYYGLLNLVILADFLRCRVLSTSLQFLKDSFRTLFACWEHKKNMYMAL